MDALVAERVSKCYGSAETRVCALNAVSICLEAGKIVALLGPSGSGKSTLIKALGLVTPPDSGDIWMKGKLVVRDGHAVADTSRLRREYLGFVFQKANLIPFLSARENVEIACEIGGEQQRMAIARALATRPSLILADEPTAALDKARGRAVMELFARVAHEQGAAVLVVTHDHRTLDAFDKLYAMEDGVLAPDSTLGDGEAHLQAP